MSGADGRLKDDAVQVYIDPAKACIARVYDAALGGKENYEIDREVIRQVKKVALEVGKMAWDGRNFLIRVTPLHR